MTKAGKLSHGFSAIDTSLRSSIAVYNWKLAGGTRQDDIIIRNFHTIE